MIGIRPRARKGRRRRFVDVVPPSAPFPPTGTRLAAKLRQDRTEQYGLTACPVCGLRCAVLVDGHCRDCNPEDAA